MHLSKLVEFSPPKVTPKVNYELWVVIMGQYRFILCKKCTTLVSNIDNGGR